MTGSLSRGRDRQGSDRGSYQVSWRGHRESEGGAHEAGYENNGWRIFVLTAMIYGAKCGGEVYR